MVSKSDMSCVMLFLQATSDLEQHIDYSVGLAESAKYLSMKIKEGFELVIEVCVFIQLLRS